MCGVCQPDVHRQLQNMYQGPRGAARTGSRMKWPSLRTVGISPTGVRFKGFVGHTGVVQGYIGIYRGFRVS